MKRYSKYKDSGISWIGEVPQHWEVKRLKQVVSLIKERGATSIKIGLENIESFTGKFLSTETVFDGEGVQVSVGDLVYGKLRPYLSKTWLASFECNAIGDFYVFRCYNNCNNHFMQYLFLSTPFSSICNASTYGAKMPRVSSIFMLPLPIPLPPLPEQEAIVAYLEGKVSLIDELVKKQEKQIDLLRELKQSVIAKAVTQGVNKDVALRSSGIPWMGEIPEHWEVKRIKYIFSECSEKGYPNEPVLCSTQKYGVIPQSMYENRVVEVNKGLEGLKLVKEGDFVISLRSFQGGIEYAYYQGIISAAYTILRLNHDCNSDYIKHLLKSFPFVQLLQTCVTGIREGQNINYALLRKNFLPIPPLPEQEAIVSYISRKTSEIDKLIAKQEAQITQLRELKQTLIADAVTGRINVQPS